MRMKQWINLVVLLIITIQLPVAIASGTGGGGAEGGGIGSPDTALFSYRGWGSYYVQGEYFIGYPKGPIYFREILTINRTLNSGQLHSILMNDNINRTINISESLPLGDGYELRIKDIDVSAREILVSLLKGGTDVDSDVISPPEDYIYRKKVGNVSDLPIIAVHIDSELVNASKKPVEITGVFQVSEAYVLVTAPTPTPIWTLVAQTPSVTPVVTATAILPVATYTPPPQPTYITPSQTPVLKPVIKKRAHLEVTYEVVPKSKQDFTILVHLKNIGNATASHISLSIDNPAVLEVHAFSGSEQAGGTILWKGELKPGEEHISQYSAKATSGKDIEIPLNVTYAKISPMEKAEALGIAVASSADAEALLSPEDWDFINLIIKIIMTLPGFEGIMVISVLLLLIRFKRK